jgi:serine/threonine-protein kinase
VADHPPDADSDAVEDPALARIVDAILDDAPVPPDTAPSAPADPGIAAQLRLLADISALHRRLGLVESGAGDQWGHLRLVEKVGQGAFGEVFRAWDPHLSREVALKLLGPAVGQGADDRSWVLKEARFLAAIRHPNVVTVHGADRIDGRVGFWTEFIHGRTLAKLVHDDGTLGAAEAAAIGVDVCRAVSAVHRAGLLHRDIKANNVMREEGGRIVLLDFGATKNVLSDVAPDAVIGDPNGPTGTPLYVAPELWRERAATPQSDIYSVGVLLYFLVTGSYPVQGATVGEVAQAHHAGKRLALRDARPDLPASFVATVERAIATDPATRFATIEELEQALSLVGRPKPAAYGSRKLLAAVALAAIAGVAVYLTWPSGQRNELVKIMAPAEAALWSRPSLDGRFLAFIDESGGVGVWDVGRNHASSAKASGPDGKATSALISRAGDRVAYVWQYSDGRSDVQVARLDGSQPTLVLERRKAQPLLRDWSHNGNELVCWLVEADQQPDLVVLPIEGGDGQVLYSGLGYAQPASMSPDGRFVVFGRMVPNENRVEAVIVGRDGAPPRVLERSGGTPEWMPDGQHLVALRPSSTDASTRDAWLVPMVNGFSAGEGVKVAENIGAMVANIQAFPTRDGRLLSVVETRRHEILTAPFDPASGRITAEPVRLIRASISGQSSPSWSPDGNTIAFFKMQTPFAPGGPQVGSLHTLDIASGRAREVPAKLFWQGTYMPAWLPHSLQVIVWGKDENSDDRLGHYRVNVRTGEATPLNVDGEPGSGPGLALLDGLIYRDRRGSRAHLTAKSRCSSRQALGRGWGGSRFHATVSSGRSPRRRAVDDRPSSFRRREEKRENCSSPIPMKLYRSIAGCRMEQHWSSHGRIRAGGDQSGSSVVTELVFTT